MAIVQFDIKPFVEILKSAPDGLVHESLSKLMLNMRWAFNSAAIRMVPPNSLAREHVIDTVQTLIHTKPVNSFFYNKDYNDYFRDLQMLWRMVRGTGTKIGESKMKVTKLQLLNILNESMSGDIDQSELGQFASSKSGKGCMRAGGKISHVAGSIRGIGDDQTGKMRNTIYALSDFIKRLGDTLSNLDRIERGESCCEILPSPAELKRIHKMLQHLEK